MSWGANRRQACNDDKADGAEYRDDNLHHRLESREKNRRRADTDDDE